MVQRLFLIALTVPLLLSSSQAGCKGARAPNPSSISNVDFARFIEQISEEGGYFWSNNYISNETSYQHVLGQLQSRVKTGGVYIGVGPNQNFTYIAHIRPKLAFIVDVRRQNMLEHFLFKLLMEKSETRIEYLSRLLGRPLRERALSTAPQQASIEDLVRALEDAVPDRAFFNSERQDVIDTLRARVELNLTAADFQDVERIYLEFFRQGLDIKYDSWRSFFFPSLKEFLLETDLEGNRRNWLAREEDFRFVRDMQRANRIIPAVGDFAGEHAFRRLGALLHARGETVSAFYLSNVEFYLFRQRKWERFVDNVRKLPIDESSLFIRAYANLHRPHPHMVGNHITVSLVQSIQNFLDNVDRGHYHNLWDVVTIGYED